MSLTGNFEPKASPRPRNTTFCLTSRLSLVSRRANPRSLWLNLFRRPDQVADGRSMAPMLLHQRLRGVLRLSRIASRHDEARQRRDREHFVVDAQNGQANASLYAAAKGAVMAFTKSLAREKAGNGIRANMVAPGPIENTPFWRKAMVSDDADAVIGQRVKSIPLGRLGQPEDVAKVIVFLSVFVGRLHDWSSRHGWRR